MHFHDFDSVAVSLCFSVVVVAVTAIFQFSHVVCVSAKPCVYVYGCNCLNTLKCFTLVCIHRLCINAH